MSNDCSLTTLLPRPAVTKLKFALNADGAISLTQPKPNQSGARRSVAAAGLDARRPKKSVSRQSQDALSSSNSRRAGETVASDQLITAATKRPWLALEMLAAAPRPSSKSFWARLELLGAAKWREPFPGSVEAAIRGQATVTQSDQSSLHNINLDFLIEASVVPYHGKEYIDFV